MADVRAIVVTYESEDTIKDCLDSLISERDYGVTTEIVVVDNSSTDGTRKIIEVQYPDVNLIKSDRNIGYGSACNLGARWAKTDYLLFLNPDIIIHGGAIQRMVRFLDKNRDVAIVGGWLEDERGIPNYSFRRYPTLALSLFHRESPLRVLLNRFGISGGYITHLEPPDKPIEVDWVLGAVLMIRREVFEKLGGFDERFFLYQEDVDLCYRAKSAGWGVYHLPDVRILHYFEHSTRKRPYLRLLMKHRSLYRFLKKADRLPPLHELLVAPFFSLNLILGFSAEMVRFLLAPES